MKYRKTTALLLVVLLLVVIGATFYYFSQRESEPRDYDERPTPEQIGYDVSEYSNNFINSEDCSEYYSGYECTNVCEVITWDSPEGTYANDVRRDCEAHGEMLFTALSGGESIHFSN